ncbi:hypothetical protein M3Y95_00226100 [Aphelenchoides besseyi]|nr:hypothetical protein M3Y95_00226100 [Aphelenchoides besseyi]
MANISGFTFESSTNTTSYEFVVFVHPNQIEISDGNHHYFYEYAEPKQFVSEIVAGKKSKITLDVMTRREFNNTDNTPIYEPGVLTLIFTSCKHIRTVCEDLINIAHYTDMSD